MQVLAQWPRWPQRAHLVLSIIDFFDHCLGRAFPNLRELKGFLLKFGAAPFVMAFIGGFLPPALPVLGA